MQISGGLTFSGRFGLTSASPSITGQYLVVAGGGKALRGNFAGVGYIYDSKNDVFYPPRPHSSWTISEATNWIWKAPTEST